MAYDVLDFKKNSNSTKEYIESIRQGVPLALFGVTDPFKYYLASRTELPVIYVVDDRFKAYSIAQEISEFLGKEVNVLPPKDELLFKAKGFLKDGLYQRICATEKLINGEFTITTAEALMQTFSARIEKIEFAVGKTYDYSTVAPTLIRLGYKRTETAEEKGTFAIRGDILDIYPTDKDNPFRIDFFGDEIENIREIDGESGKSSTAVKKLTVVQAVECVFSSEDLSKMKGILEKEVVSAPQKAKDRLREFCYDYEDGMERLAYDELSLLSLLSEESRYFDEIIDKDTVIIFDEPKKIAETSKLIETEFTERYNSLKAEGEVFAFQSQGLLNFDDFSLRAKKFRLVAMQTLSSAVSIFNPLKIINPTVSGVANYHLDIKELYRDAKNWLRGGYKIALFTGDSKRSERLSLDFSENGMFAVINGSGEENICIFDKRIERGFVYHEEKQVIIGCVNLFFHTGKTQKFKSKKQKYFSAPEAGDYAVHEVYGIGKVLGNKKITTTEGTKDYVSVEYANNDILYVPVEQMDVLTRYLGGEKKPTLSKLGGDFEKVKQRVRESIRAMSIDLKKLYDERNSLKGFKYEDDASLKELFESEFPYEDTPDQVTANRDIEEDMTTGKVMDRLICGDVGFGKTEVAFRAGFRAITNGKQVCMLAPTTILTEQHFNTAKKRFSHFGINVACLNRFRTDKEQRKIKQDTKDGKVDFLIGTHRLLSSDVAFKDLGLLILDEEQRFGVEHKEKIKLLKKNVDTLTLSATPIPRTLHMSLSGIRSISTIATPPKKRLSVQTYVTEETDVLIKDAVSREINRGGQAFILYNRVESIYTFSEKVRAILPKARITVCHGQMDERSLERNIMEFYNGKTDILISTTIIENGIDLPNANTLIVIDADKLGLSTLYQLKGRVGRSDRLAYAYFTFKKEKILTETAYKRLNAIVEFAEMGSGVKIAMRDLEIRGAGNVLGAEQHGHMDKIGYELYSKLLREEIEGEEEIIPELDIRVTAFIPDGYVSSNSAKMSVYKEIAEITDEKDALEVAENIKDAYGELPEEVKNLINIAQVKRLAMKLKVSAINVYKNTCQLVFDNLKTLLNSGMGDIPEKYADTVRLTVVSKPALDFSTEKRTNAEMLELLKQFLTDTVK